MLEGVGGERCIKILCLRAVSGRTRASSLFLEPWKKTAQEKSGLEGFLRGKCQESRQRLLLQLAQPCLYFPTSPCWPEPLVAPRGVTQSRLGRSWGCRHLGVAKVGHGGDNGTYGYERVLTGAGILFLGQVFPWASARQCQSCLEQE